MEAEGRREMQGAGAGAGALAPSPPHHLRPFSFFSRSLTPPSPGMTLGIMGLDKVGLQIVATAGDTEKERRHARELKTEREGREKKRVVGSAIGSVTGKGVTGKAPAGRPSSTCALNVPGRGVSLACTPP